MATLDESAPETAEVEPRHRHAVSRGSVVGGASSGTLMVAVAQEIGPHTGWGIVLTLAAPTVSVVTGALVQAIKFQATWYYERWQVHQYRKVLEKSVTSSHSSEAAKARIKKKLDEFDQAVADDQLARVKALKRRVG
ncbi:hypothetical protein [Streptomyces silvisoli]|uniref:DUF4231 domain-containing protein n=1 Tax=Streptomyces silvisoli TaxID=3034235 RepID=A0ABT5ZUR4_9ACTN|nr:hypothetical protein [Streptomyces silvisoli]MDF3293391.1 hypothetical protein [Streptomyces silvisoli]